MTTTPSSRPHSGIIAPGTSSHHRHRVITLQGIEAGCRMQPPSLAPVATPIPTPMHYPTDELPPCKGMKQDAAALTGSSGHRVITAPILATPIPMSYHPARCGSFGATHTPTSSHRHRHPYRGRPLALLPVHLYFCTMIYHRHTDEWPHKRICMIKPIFSLTYKFGIFAVLVPKEIYKTLIYRLLQKPLFHFCR